MSDLEMCEECGALYGEDEGHACPVRLEGGPTTPRFWEPFFRRPLTDEIADTLEWARNHQTAARRGPWMGDRRVSPPGEWAEHPASRITDLTVTFDTDLEDREDIRSAGRALIDEQGQEPLPVAYIETEAQDELARSLPRYCPSCGSDHIRVTVEMKGEEPVHTELECSACEPGQ